MGEINLSFRNKKFSFRAVKCWNDLTRRQLLLWCGILRMELSVDEALDLASPVFYKIPKVWWNRLSAVHRYELREQLQFLLEIDLTDNVLEYFRIGFRTYYGPANRLSNLTIAEYRHTELYYDMYVRTGQIHFLLLLAATLFRPKHKWRGDDAREPLDDYKIGRRAELFRWALHPATLYAVRIFYEGCRGYVRKQFPTIYKLHVQADGPFNQQKQGDQLQDLEDHILAFSGDKFGTYQETQNTNLYLFMKNMAERIEEYERSKAERA